MLIHAAAGGIGLIACQWANALGAHVIGTVGSKAKADLAHANGCDHVILYHEEDFVARVKQISRDELCDVVYDGVGKATFPGSLDCIRPRGMFVSFGNASGPMPPLRSPNSTITARCLRRGQSSTTTSPPARTCWRAPTSCSPPSSTASCTCRSTTPMR